VEIMWNKILDFFCPARKRLRTAEEILKALDADLQITTLMFPLDDIAERIEDFLKHGKR